MNDSAEDTKKQVIAHFVQEVQLSCHHKGYIDQHEETYLLGIAYRSGLNITKSFVFIRITCGKLNVPIQKDIEKLCLEQLAEAYIRAGNFVLCEDFKRVCQFYHEQCSTWHTLQEIKRRLKQLIIQKGWTVQEGGFRCRNWFSEIL